MIEFLFGYWIGRDSQKDPVGTITALIMVPFLALAFFWAYYAFIGFAKSSWAIFLQYSAYTTVNTDLIVLGALAVLNFLVVRLVNDSSKLRFNIILFVEKAVFALISPWIVLDIAYKTNFASVLATHIQTIFFGTVDASASADIIPFGLMSDLSLYAIAAGAIALASCLIPFAVAGTVIYMIVYGKKSMRSCNEGTPCADQRE